MSLNWEKLCDLAVSEIEATLQALPQQLRDRTEKLPVTFDPSPSVDLQADGIAPDTLGLFVGAEFVDEETVLMPPQIILFLENIRGFAQFDEKMFEDEVRTTFLHGLGHYFGLDEDDLAERDLE